MGRLLLLGCSQAKVSDPEPLPAIERYDGPAFRLVRRFLRTAPAPLQDVDIYILSARYGLIPATTEIADYDERMTPRRAAALRADTLSELQQIVEQTRPTRLFISLGRDYLAAIEGFEARLPPFVQVTVSREPAGKQLTALRAWLYEEPPPTARRREGGVRQPDLPPTARRSVRIRGQTLSLSLHEALDQARQALAEGRGNPERYRTWYALVDGRKVNTKWWVSQLSGLPVSAFAADEARRVLRGLGIEVYRVGD